MPPGWTTHWRAALSSSRHDHKRRSVLGGLFRAIDDEDLDRHSSRLNFQSKLFLNLAHHDVLATLITFCSVRCRFPADKIEREIEIVSKPVISITGII